jgi:hypothetical protein
VTRLTRRMTLIDLRGRSRIEAFCFEQLT